MKQWFNWNSIIQGKDLSSNPLMRTFYQGNWEKGGILRIPKIYTSEHWLSHYCTTSKLKTVSTLLFGFGRTRVMLRYSIVQSQVLVSVCCAGPVQALTPVSQWLGFQGLLGTEDKDSQGEFHLIVNIARLEGVNGRGGQGPDLRCRLHELNESIVAAIWQLYYSHCS